MAMAIAHHRESSSGSLTRHLDSTGKYVRYTSEQVEALERVYAECQSQVLFKKAAAHPGMPNSFKHRAQTDQSLGFRNRRCQQQPLMQAVILWSPPPQPSKTDANNPAGLLSLQRRPWQSSFQRLQELPVDWVQPGPDSVGIFAISQSCGGGVAARACGLVSLEPAKVYAPTTLALLHVIFGRLRYTITLENGSLVVCERSLSGSGAGPSPAAAAQFVRAEMPPSGYLIRPCDEDVVIAVNSTKNFGTTSNPAESLTYPGGVLCAKASIATPSMFSCCLQCNIKPMNVPTCRASSFLERKHRSEWADFNIDALLCSKPLKANSYAYPGMRPTSFTGSQIIRPTWPYNRARTRFVLNGKLFLVIYAV
ncbi:Homeobox-leucine zipper protein REVOLUTA, partial [Cucurbita argyrosperma subsp. sororia]